MNQDADLDRIARRMTDVEPSADLRARVLVALPEVRRPWWPRRGAPATAVVAVAASAAVVFGTGPLLRRAELPDIARRIAQVRPVPTLTAASRANEPAHRSTITAAARARLAEESAAALAWRARALPPLPAIAPVAVDAIQPEALTIAPITVDRLNADPIVVPPIDRD